jgi:hypothetical protein
MPDLKTRRDVLAAGASVGVLTASLLAGQASAATPVIANAPRQLRHVDWNDPYERFRLQVKMRGTLDDAAVSTFVRLHIYGYANEGNLVPFFSMNNYAVNVWRRLSNGNHAVQVFECGVYTAFDSYDVITEWLNPFTDELREVHQFRSGPLNVEFGPDGIIAGPETTVKPRAMAAEVVEDTVMASTQSSFLFPSPFQPDEFPKESPGRLFHWDSHTSHMSPLEAVLDPDVASAPASVTLTNLVSWAPWLGMSQRPGRTYGRGIGRKVSDATALPAPVLKSLETYMPQVLDIENWGPPYDDVADYKQRLEAERRGS